MNEIYPAAVGEAHREGDLHIHDLNMLSGYCAGLTPMTTLDYPDHLAGVIFLQGCPLRCGYCHNPQMLEPRRAKPDEWAEVEAFLDTRRGLLEGMVFSGGEPTLHAHLPLAAARVRGLGFKVGAHRCVYPRRLAAILPYLKQYT